MIVYPTDGLEDETPQNELVKGDGNSPEAMPAQIVESEIMDAESTESKSVDAEIVDEADDNKYGNAAFPNQQTTTSPMAKKLFRLARQVSVYDPARQWMGFRYEDCLRRECEITLEILMWRYDRAGLEYVIEVRQRNRGFFQCLAIDSVLYAIRDAYTRMETN